MANLFDDLIAAAKAPAAAPTPPVAVEDDPPPLAVTVHGNVPRQVDAPAPSTAAPNLFDDVIAAAAAPRGAVISPPSAEPVVASSPVPTAAPAGGDVPEATAPGQTPAVPPQTTVAATGVVPPTTYVSPDDAVRALADGATFGLADKFAAAMDTLPDGRVLPLDAPVPTPPSYKDALEVERARTASLPDEVKVAGQVGGGLLAAPLLAGSGLLATTNLAPKATALMRSLAGAIDGFRFGAANAFGHHDGAFDDRAAHEAVADGAMGAGVGSSLPVVGKLVGAGYRRAGTLLTGGKEATGNLSRAARALIATGLRSDGITAERLGAMHPEEMGADLGPASLGLTMGAAANPVKGGAIAIQRLNARNAGRTGRLLSTVDEHLGADQAAESTAREIQAAREATVAPLVEAGSAGTVAPGALAERPSVAKALNAAGEIAAERGTPSARVFTDASGHAMPSAAHETYLAGSRRRLDAALQRLLGTGGQMATVDEITARRAAEAAPHYERGFASTIDYGSEAGQRLLALLKRVPANARNAATLIMRMEGTLPEAAEAALVPHIPSAPTAAEPAPSSLSRFLSKMGGVAPTDDLKHVGVTGRVVRKGGMDVDRAREAAAEAGYLPHDSTPNDLLDLLDREARGQKVYPAGTSPAAKLNAAKEEVDRETHEAAKREVLGAVLARNPDLTKVDMDAVNSAAHALAFGTEHQDPLAAYSAATNRTSTSIGPAEIPGAAEDASKLTPAFWDYVKRGLDSMVEGTRNPITGKVDTVGRAASSLRHDLLGALDEAVPDLATARGIYADESLGLDALESGRKSVAPSVSRERVARDFAPLSDHERDLYRLGQGNALRETLSKASDNANLPQRLVGNEQIREKLATTASSPAAVERFNAAIAEESRHFTESMAAQPRDWMNAYNLLKAEAEKTAPGALREARMATASDLRAVLSRNNGFRQAIAAGEHFDKVTAAHAAGPAAIAGREATHPAELAQQWASMSPDERAAMFKGLRSEIGRRVGTSPNDLVALRRAVGGEADFSGANIRTIAGDEAANGVVAGVDRETKFAGTHQSVTGNSVTATKKTMSDLIEEKTAEPSRPKVDTTWLGLAKGAAEIAVRKGYRLLGNATSDNVRRELAAALTEKGTRFAALAHGVLQSNATVASKASQLEKLFGDPRLARQLAQAATSPLTVDVPGGRSARR